MRKVVVPQQRHDFAYRKSFLHRHQRLTLLGIGRMDADGYMHRGLVKQSPQPGDIAHGGHGNAFGTPSQTPRGGKNLDGVEHGIEVVCRFAHAHEYDIRKVAALRYG